METQRSLSVGETLDIGGYTMRYDGFLGGQIAEDGRVMDIAEVSVIKGDQVVANIRPRRDFYPGAEGMNSMTIAGTYSTLQDDFYVLLVEWEEIGSSSATFKVYVNPLINLVWWGGLLMMVGTVVAMWSGVPEKQKVAAAIKVKPAIAAGD